MFVPSWVAMNVCGGGVGVIADNYDGVCEPHHCVTTHDAL